MWNKCGIIPSFWGKKNQVSGKQKQNDTYAMKPSHQLNQIFIL
jgi:hypothetical protein